MLRSHHWLHDQLMAQARPPSTFTWAGPDDEPDLTVYLVPPGLPDADPHPTLRMLKAKDLGRLYLFSQDDDAWFWGPGVFAAATEACPPEIAGGFYLHPDQLTPGSVGSLIEASRQRVPDLLWSFVGNLVTAPTLRGTLISLGDQRAEARESVVPWDIAPQERARRQTQYVETLTRSKFVVCPRGFAPSSHRLFEAMRAGRVPVVVSDAWRPPPLVDWSSCSIRIPESDVHNLPEILREREQDSIALGLRAREVWEERFSPQGMVHQLVETCIMLDSRGVPPVRRLEMAVKSVPTLGARRRLGSMVKPRLARLRGAVRRHS